MPKIGLQLYTVKDEAARDLLGTLRSVAEMGYEGVEFAGYHDVAPEAIAGVLSQTGLVSAATHIMLGPLEARLDEEVATCRTLACPTIICPFVPKAERETADDWRTVAERFNRMGRALSEFGIRFLYHHHGYDFEPVDGTTGFQILLDSTDPAAVAFELDAYWLEVAGIDCSDFYLEHRDRVPSLHFKNMRSRTDHHDVELADGAIDLQRLATLAIEHGVEWLVVEQEKFDRDPMESARINRRHLSEMAAKR